MDEDNTDKNVLFTPWLLSRSRRNEVMRQC